MTVFFKKIMPDSPTAACLMFLLSLTPLIALIAPRFLAFWPGIIGLVVAVPVFLHYRAPLHWPRAYIILSGIVLAVAGLSCFWALDQSFAVERVLKIALIIMPAVLLLYALAALPLKALKAYLPLFIWVPLLTALLCVYDIKSDFPIYRFCHDSYDGDLSGVQLNRSVIAILCTLCVALAVSQLLKKPRHYILGILSVFGLLFFMTQSQSAQLGGVAALLCYFAFPYSRAFIWYGVMALLAFCTIASPFIAIMMYESFAASVATMPFVGEGIGYGAQRLEIWDSVGRYALQQPWLGYGIEATRFITDFDMDQMYRESNTALHPHNFALQLWIEFGVIGACAGAAFCIYILRQIRGLTFEAARTALAVFMIILAAASFGYGLWQSWFLGLMVLMFAFTVLITRFCAADKNK